MASRRVRLYAQPLVMGGCYTVLVGVASLTVRVRSFSSAMGWAVAALAVSYLTVTHLPRLPRPDNETRLVYYRDWDDVIFRNDARNVLPMVVATGTILPALFLPLSAYPIGVLPVLLGLVGVWVTVWWLSLRWTAQYLPSYSPHLFDDEYVRPIEDD